MERSIPSYEKVFSRDFSLATIEIWYRGESINPKQWTEEKQPVLPYMVFERSEGTVHCYYDKRGVRWVKDLLLTKARHDQMFLFNLEETVLKKLEYLRPIYEEERVLNTPELVKFLALFEEGYPWFEAMWWLCELSTNELGGLDISNIKNVRELTAKLSTGTDAVIRKSLAAMYPELADFVGVLTVEEIRLGKFPDDNELKKREEGYIFTNNQLYTGATLEEVEKKFGIKFERIRVGKNVTEIKGQCACPGLASGIVRKIMGHKDIGKLKENEILVSPMTMPDFVPAIKKAKAIITDEGGITCHAAIVCREMGRPCIVGTKVATKLLNDGDFVEIDANKGIVKLLKKITI
jgi:phosphohistidine swiveling domain-containing protein